MTDIEKLREDLMNLEIDSTAIHKKQLYLTDNDITNIFSLVSTHYHQEIEKLELRLDESVSPDEAREAVKEARQEERERIMKELANYHTSIAHHPEHGKFHRLYIPENVWHSLQSDKVKE